MTRVAINGFGRIGRQSLKAMLEYYPDDLEIVAINDMADHAVLAHLLRYDSSYGTFEGEVTAYDDYLAISYDDVAFEVQALAEPETARLPWRALDVELVIEASGQLRDARVAQAHLEAGAQKVLITAPVVGADITLCMGVNHARYDPVAHHLLASASCTSYCLAPLAQVLHERFGITRGMFTVIHAYTDEQRLHDGAHYDLRRARAAALNLVPTTSGAAQALGQLIPALEGRLTGYAVRVPTPTVSLLDLTVQLGRPASVEAVNDAVIAASEGEELEQIFSATEEELVSSDYIGNPHSATVDLKLTTAVGDELFKLVAWFDNEWSYGVRIADTAAFIGDAMDYS